MSRPVCSQEDLDEVFARVSQLAPGGWDSLNGERIFITGATGFFGKWLLATLLDAIDRKKLKTEVWALSRSPGVFKKEFPSVGEHPAMRWVTGDLVQLNDLVLPPGKFRFVIHAGTAAQLTLTTTQPELQMRTIVEGTRHILNWAQKAECERFLFTSSGGVYGKQPSNITHVPEDSAGRIDPSDPIYAYGHGKVLAEELCAEAHRRNPRFQPLIARCFAFVGPHLPLDLHFAVGNFIRDALKGGPIQIGGDGTPHRSYLYSADLAAWLWVILFRGEALRIYHVGSEHSLSIADIAHTVALQFQTPTSRIEVKIAKQADPGQPPARYVPSTARTRSELGLEEWTSLPLALRRTLHYLGHR